MDCPEYLCAAVIGGLLVICFRGWMKRWLSVWIMLDALGVGVFAYIGAKAAYNSNLGPHTAIFCAVVTAAGGGCLRDIIARQTPGCFSGGCYLASALLAGICHAICHQLAVSPMQVMSVVPFIGFATRMITYVFDVQIPLIHQGKWHRPNRQPLIRLRPLVQKLSEKTWLVSKKVLLTLINPEHE
jgi:uncharacterized membrane protein YeiH